MVECYWPGIERDVTVVLDHIARLTGHDGRVASVWPFGCIVVPSEGLALFLFRAPGEAQVQRIGELAEVPFDLVVEAVDMSSVFTTQQ